MGIAVAKFRIAVYGVLIEQGRFLMTETAVPSGTIFNFPGGGLELGEAPCAALAREYREETDTSVDIGPLLFCSQEFHQNPDYPNEQLMHIYYRVSRNTDDPISQNGNGDDVRKVVWVRYPDLAGLRVMPVDLEFTSSSVFRGLVGA